MINQRETLSNLTESAKHKNTIIDFSSLNCILELKEDIQTMKEQLTRIEEYYKPKYDLTKQSGVIRFLDISESTLVKYRKEGILKEGYHYNRKIKGSKSIITYVSGAIEEFKKEKPK